MATKAQHSPRYRPVPKLLKALRKGLDITQRELAERLGRPQSWVHNCETGNRRVDVAEFCDWAAACDVKPLDAVKRYLGEVR
jgi:transcriptional regulator with XRE-family HTH domain